RMMDYVKLIEETEEGILDDHDDHDEEHSHEGVPHLHEYDEHIWTDPQNALRISEGIANWLSSTDTSHAEYYQGRMASYGDELRALDETFKQIVEQAPRREIIVADRFPLIYFTSAYGLDYVAAFPGCAAETDPKPRTVAAIIEKVRQDHIPYIFYIELSNRQLSGLIAEETGAQELLFHTAHNVAKEDFEKGVTYLEIMKQNAENLRRGLGE
ncbi:MAG TPA: metal ABC transporter substrate-binding protein, partial [Clostridia bacterium]|nr:metal ABC transporter substrate-binding protein [Clostridia bacterium]